MIWIYLVAGATALGLSGCASFAWGSYCQEKRGKKLINAACTAEHGKGYKAGYAQGHEEGAEEFSKRHQADLKRAMELAREAGLEEGANAVQAAYDAKLYEAEKSARLAGFQDGVEASRVECQARLDEVTAELKLKAEEAEKAGYEKGLAHREPPVSGKKLRK